MKQNFKLHFGKLSASLLPFTLRLAHFGRLSTVLCIAFYLLPFVTSAQPVQWDWVVQAGGTSDDYPYMLTVDNEANVYSTGKYNNIAVFGMDTVQSTNIYSGIFITKIDSSGSFIWTKTDNSSNLVYPNWINTDNNGNVYLSGDFIDTLKFESYILTSTGDVDGFLINVDGWNMIQWLYQMGNPGWLVSHGIEIDIDGCIYIVGGFNDSITYSDSVIYGNDWSAFLLKIDQNGELFWIEGYGTSYGLNVNGISKDLGNNIIFTGYIGDSCDFGDTLIISNGGTDAFVAKVSSTGDLQWVRNMGGTGTDVGISVTNDQDNNVFVLGFFPETGYFGDTSIVSVPPLTDLFYSKLSPSGEFLWTKSIITSFSAYDDHNRHSIECDNDGNLYMTAWFWDTLIVEGVPYYSAGVYDSFIMKTDPNGNMIWIKQITGTESQYCKSLDIDNNGNIYVTGRFYGTAYFDSLELTSYGSADVFIGKLHEEPVSVWYNNVNKTLDVKVYPNPASNYLNIDVDNMIKRAELYSTNGSLVKVYSKNLHQLDISNLPSETYMLKMYFTGTIHSQKIIIY